MFRPLGSLDILTWQKMIEQFLAHTAENADLVEQMVTDARRIL
jgi:hypothetical protein